MRRGAAQVLEILTGALLVFSGTAKWVAPDPALCLLVHDVFPGDWTVPALRVAETLPGVEIVAGCGLATGVATRLHLTVATVLSLLFLGTLSLALLGGLDLADCGCFGMLGRGGGPSVVFGKSMLFLAACGALWVVLPSRPRLSLDPK